MKRKRHTEEQIIAILKEHEAGCRRPIFAAGTRSARRARITTGRHMSGAVHRWGNEGFGPLATPPATSHNDRRAKH
jgi:hypothetical protein